MSAETTRSESLAEALPREQQRVRELLPLCDAVPMGFIAATFMRQALTRAEQASASGDVVAMLRCYEELKGFSV